MSPSKSLDVGSTVSSNERADDKVAMQDEPRGEEYPSSFRLLAVIIALVLSMFLASLDMTIIATAIPKITGMSAACGFDQKTNRRTFKINSTR